MIDQFFQILRIVDDFFWGHVGFLLILIVGLYLSVKSRFFQFRVLAGLSQTLQDVRKANTGPGTNPLKLYFASVGGMVGLGNIVAVISALIIGGPGALFWLWLASFSGMLIKYSEIYLGILYRVPNAQGGYDGGPMYYLQQAFSSKSIPIIVSLLLCVYGVDVYQFLIVSDTLSTTFACDRLTVIAVLLAAILYTGIGGVKRLANVCTLLMPPFIIMYVLMCLWVIFSNLTLLPALLQTIFATAFTGHAPLGGFVGSTFIVAAQQGISRAVYSGDIGVGYDATIQCETRSLRPEYQARLAIFGLLTDSIICTMSMLTVLLTGVWTTGDPRWPSKFVATALAQHFPYVDWFMAIFFFFAGFTTLIAFFTVGLKSARFLAPRLGPPLYVIYAIFAFSFFAFFDQTKAILLMSLSGGLLVLLNLLGILRLRHHIEFR